MSGVPLDISFYFCTKPYDNSAQMNIRNNYSTMYWHIDSIAQSGPEKSVAKRKLLESMDAALRATE